MLSAKANPTAPAIITKSLVQKIISLSFAFLLRNSFTISLEKMTPVAKRYESAEEIIAAQMLISIKIAMLEGKSSMIKV